MEFVVHNRRNMTLRAAFIVAFFASFFGYSQDAINPFKDGTIDLRDPKIEKHHKFNCNNGESSVIVQKSDDSATAAKTCHDKGNVTDYANRVHFQSCGDKAPEKVTVYESDAPDSFTYRTRYLYECPSGAGGFSYYSGFVVGAGTETTQVCPPDSHPTYVSQHSISEDFIKCYDPADLQDFYDKLADENRADNNCSNLVLDSGNNSAATMCYSSPTGNSCNVEMVQGGGFSYYQGTSANPLGCSNSENPPYDNQGVGDENDKCVNVGQGNYCAADKSKHCTGSGANEVCDEGCLSFDTLFMCDASKHPDVGEGDSDYFDPNGTCSVVAGSAYKGACEELGGVWDKSGDYTDTSCPATSISGSCSVGTNGGCFACLDAGGTWTPDPNAPLNNTEKGIQDVASLAQETNDNLKVLDNSLRKGNDALISTIKSTNAKLVGEIKTLTGKGSGGIGSVVAKLDELKEEKESYTTNASKPNKSKINGLFDANSTTTLKAEIEVLKTELTTQFNTIRAEGASLFSIQVPTSTGYQARSLDLTYGSVDMSLSRFSQYFALLAGPIMFIASVIAGFILLGSRK